MLGKLALEHLHAQQPLRVWSVIVTVFGDLVMDEGKEAEPKALSTAALLDIMALLRIDPAHVRTALSRLVANGTLDRTRIGKASFHTLTPAARAAFRDASELVYGRHLPSPNGQFHLVLTDACTDRAAARDTLGQQGFCMSGATTALKPAWENQKPTSLPAGAIHGFFDPDPSARSTIAELFKIPALTSAYIRFNDAFGSMANTAFPSNQDALTAKLCLVHQFRRIVLKDPFLPMTCLRMPWAGDAARVICSTLLERVREPARRQFSAMRQ